jgi:hypothetical protein
VALVGAGLDVPAVDADCRRAEKSFALGVLVVGDVPQDDLGCDGCALEKAG